MSSKPVDVVGSFANILENGSKWNEKVTELVEYTSKKHTEFKLEYSKQLQRAKPRRVKNRPICSLHSGDGQDVQMTSPQPTISVQTPLDPTEISPLDAGNQYIYTQAIKKRRIGTSVRSGASGPPKFRSKQQVVIYYDGYVQQQLDVLVKEFGGCRNTLRKGRMAYTVSKGLQLPTLRRGLDYHTLSNYAPNKPPLIYGSSPKLSVTSEKLVIPESAPTGEAAFLQADKDLEDCQSACETAAHQFLRDGDCRIELDTVLNKLQSVLQLAKTTHDALKAEEEEEKTERSDSMSDSIHTTSGSTLVEKQSREYISLYRKTGTTLIDDSITKDRPPLHSTVSAPPATMDIEVDDDTDTSDIEIDIKQFSINRSARMHV